ncbi:MAG: flagellar FlbD family protein [Tissierellia bacterium]|nr:flagellar FlbD family protein [Tissierellia bacterium]
MIVLTSLNKEKFALNCDLIYRIDEAHDTIITLIDGKTLRVMESTEEIIQKIIEYKRNIYSKLPEGV